MLGVVYTMYEQRRLLCRWRKAVGKFDKFNLLWETESVFANGILNLEI